MLFGNEVYALKKLEADKLRSEKLARKLAQEEESTKSETSRRQKQLKIQKLEAELREAYSRKTKSKKSSVFSVSSYKPSGLEKFKELHNLAKGMIYGNKVDFEISPGPKQAKSPPDAQRESYEDGMTVPIYIPQSLLKKSQKLPPPTVQKALKNGEVITYHLLDTNTPVYDPLVRAEAKFSKEDIDNLKKNLNGKPLYEELEKLAKDLYLGNRKEVPEPLNSARSRSIAPKVKYLHNKGECPELPPIPHKPQERSFTPIANAYFHSFREFSNNESPIKPKRDWVSKRIREYSSIVKQHYKPVVSEKKSLELQLLREKSQSRRPSPTKKMNLLNMTSQM